MTTEFAEVSSGPGVDAAPGPSWPPALERTLQCPACGRAGPMLRPEPHCPACDWRGRTRAGVPDFVDEREMSPAQRAELEAQARAVGDYYENEEKLSCHWDRISAGRLPEMLGLTGGLVLDLGCGTGSAGAALRRAGAMVVGADLALPCLMEASRRLDAVVRCDASRLPFRDGAFDAIVSRGALHHIESPAAALAEARRVLRPGGRALFLDPREFSWLEPIKARIRRSDAAFSEDHHAYALDEYARMIGEHFELEGVHTLYPLGILVTVGLDLFPLPRMLPKRLIAAGLLRLDEAFNKTPLRSAGHLIAVVARRRA